MQYNWAAEEDMLHMAALLFHLVVHLGQQNGMRCDAKLGTCFHEFLNSYM